MDMGDLSGLFECFSSTIGDFNSPPRSSRQGCNSKFSLYKNARMFPEVVIVIGEVTLASKANLEWNPKWTHGYMIIISSTFKRRQTVED